MKRTRQDEVYEHTTKCAAYDKPVGSANAKTLSQSPYNVTEPKRKRESESLVLEGPTDGEGQPDGTNRVQEEGGALQERQDCETKVCEKESRSDNTFLEYCTTVVSPTLQISVHLHPPFTSKRATNATRLLA